MGSIIAGALIDRARKTLLETRVSDQRWTRTVELLSHYNAGQRTIAKHKRDAYVVEGSVVLVAGAKQTVPAGGLGLFQVAHNTGVAGTTPGVAITLIDRKTLTDTVPDWMTTVGAYVEHFLYDQRAPKTWYAYPRPAGTWYVHLSYPGTPPVLLAADIDSAVNGLIAVDDIYEEDLHDYIVGYALLKRNRSGDMNAATYYLQKFSTSMGLAFETDRKFEPIDQEGAEATPNALGKP